MQVHKAWRVLDSAGQAAYGLDDLEPLVQVHAPNARRRSPSEQAEPPRPHRPIPHHASREMIEARMRMQPELARLRAELGDLWPRGVASADEGNPSDSERD